MWKCVLLGVLEQKVDQPGWPKNAVSVSCYQ